MTAERRVFVDLAEIAQPVELPTEPMMPMDNDALAASRAVCIATLGTANERLISAGALARKSGDLND